MHQSSLDMGIPLEHSTTLEEKCISNTIVLPLEQKHMHNVYNALSEDCIESHHHPAVNGVY